MWRLLLLIFCILQIFSFNAQTVPAYRHLRLDPANGLKYADNNVFFGSDTFGYLWIGSDGGVYRFDGQQLTRFWAGDPNFNDGVRSSIFSDTLGNALYGTPSGIVSIDHRTQSANDIKLGDSLAGQFGIHLIGKDSGSNKWWASNGAELFSLDQRFQPEIRCASKAVRHLLFPQNDSMVGLGFPWLIHRGLERIKRNPRTGVISIERSTDRQVQAAMINEGVLINDRIAWLTSDIGLIGYSVKKDSCFHLAKIPHSISKKVWDILQIGNKLLVATNTNGLWWFDPETGKYIGPLKSSTPGLTEKPRALHRTAQGQILVGRAEGGVDILIPQRFSITNLLSSATTNGSKPLVVAEENGVQWILLTSGTLYKYVDQKLIKHRRLQFDTQSNKPIGIALDPHSKDLIVAFEQEVTFFNLTTGKKSRQGIHLPHPIHKLFSVDSTLITETTEGLYKLENNNLIKLNNPVLKSGLAAEVLQKSTNEIVLNYGDEMIYSTILSDSGFIVQDSIEIQGELLCIAQKATRETTYIGTSSGVYKSSDPHLTRWKLDSHLLKNLAIKSILPVDFERFWICSDSGLAFFDGNLWTWLSEDNGIPNAKNGTNEISILQDESLLLSSDEGVYLIQDKDPKFEKNKVYVLLDKLWVNNNPHPIPKTSSHTEINLPYNKQEVQFEFKTVGIYDKDLPTLTYLIPSLTKGWSSIQKDGVLKLTPLPVGRHELQIRAQSSDKTESEILRISIQIKLPLWQRWWFILTSFLALVLLIVGIINSFFRRKLRAERELREKQILLTKERDRIARDLHDDLGTDLSTILFLADDGEDLDKKDLLKIVTLSRKSLSKMRKIVMTLSDEALKNQTWLENIISEAKSRCERHSIKFTCNFLGTDKVQLSQKVDLISRKEVRLILREALENAIRHGHPNSIILNLISDNENHYIIEFKDDGSGFRFSETMKGLGLSNLKRRANKLNAELKITSNLGSGTLIRLSIPVH